MINDEHDAFEDLAKSYPELMEISTLNDSIEVGIGWHGIIDQLCRTIFEPFENAKNRYRAAVLFPRNDNGIFLLQCEIELAAAKEELPVLAQIKEKYGTLRIYVHNSSDRVDDLIRLTENISSCICEECGSPGKLDKGGGWVKTHCIKHTLSDIEIQEQFFDGKISPKFQDNEV